MPDDTAQEDTPQPPAVIVSGVLRQRDPAVFSGTDDHDVEDWLSSYELVSRHNKWDDATKLHNVLFYLTGVANLWFRNHEHDFTTWTAFKTSFAEVFGRPAVRKLRAEQRLRGRAQLHGETFTSYIEDVIDLCRRVNSSMAEQDKIKHIMKGIDEDAFQMLLAKDPRTVADVINLCQSFDELRKQRILARRPPPTEDSLAALVIGDNQTTLLTQIKEFVREEVARQLSILPTTEKPSHSLAPAIRQMIQEQVTEALPSSSQPAPVAAPLTYAEAAARAPRLPVFSPPPSAPRPPLFSPAPLPRQPAAHFFGAQQQDTNPWRTADNRPICYACGTPGHVARFCRRRFPAFMGTTRAPNYGFRPFRMPQQPPPEVYVADDVPAPEYQPFGARRSPSPRRRSLSPMRRRPSASTEAEN